MGRGAASMLWYVSCGLLLMEDLSFAGLIIMLIGLRVRVHEAGIVL